jgi:hypothetical protein
MKRLGMLNDEPCPATGGLLLKNDERQGGPRADTIDPTSHGDAT